MGATAVFARPQHRMNATELLTQIKIWSKSEYDHSNFVYQQLTEEPSQPQDAFKSSVAWLLKSGYGSAAAQSVRSLGKGVRNQNMEVFGQEFMQKLDSGLGACSKHIEL